MTLLPPLLIATVGCPHAWRREGTLNKALERDMLEYHSMKDCVLDVDEWSDVCAGFYAREDNPIAQQLCPPECRPGRPPWQAVRLESPMRWHALLAALSGLFLTLPLVWLLHAAMFEQSTSLPHAQGKAPVPMLSDEQRRGLLTYGHHCETDRDCESPLQCFFSSHTMSRYCTDSRCMTDLQCREGFVCRTQRTSDGTPLRICSLAGERKEGEVCIEHSPSNDYACEKDLLCQSRCGRRCKPEDPSSCPEGFFCQEGPLDGPSCLPTCEGRTCPDGQRCVALDKPPLKDRHASICATVYGRDCQQDPCPQEQFCLLQTPPQPADAVWMQCISACGQGAPPCPEGSVCHQNRCQPSCSPEDASSCEPGFVCHRKTAKEPWRCVPAPSSSP